MKRFAIFSVALLMILALGVSSTYAARTGSGRGGPSPGDSNPGSSHVGSDGGSGGAYRGPTNNTTTKPVDFGGNSQSSSATDAFNSNANRQADVQRQADQASQRQLERQQAEAVNRQGQDAGHLRREVEIGRQRDAEVVRQRAEREQARQRHKVQQEHRARELLNKPNGPALGFNNRRAQDQTQRRDNERRMEQQRQAQRVNQQSSGNVLSLGNKPRPTANTNPFNGPVHRQVFVADSRGNVVPVKPRQQVTSSPDSRWIQVRDASGKPTGDRLDGPHAAHSDPRAQSPHAHRNGVNNEDGTPWLPAR